MIKQTLVLGIGNTLLADEGAGIHALEYLEARYPEQPDLMYLDGGTLSFNLASHIEHADNLIVLDAAQLQAPAGTVRLLEGADMDRFVGKGSRSVHEVGLIDLMDMARMTESLPVHRALIGIQPHTLGWGMEPSLPVARALPIVEMHFVSLIQSWTGRRPVDCHHTGLKTRPSAPLEQRHGLR